MKTQKFFFSFFLILAVFSACQKEFIPKPLPEPGYPTTYEILSQSEWNVRNGDFQKINIYEGLTLNEYGFVEGEIPLIENDTFTKDIIVSIVDNLILKYKSYLGIPENADINYEEKLRIDVPYMIPFGSVNIKWFFENEEQYSNVSGWSEMMKDVKYEFFLTQISIDNRKLLGPSIHFYFKKNEKTLTLINNWYPRVFMPTEEIYSIDDAVTLACRELLKQTGENFWESKHKFGIVKLFYPLKTESGIEIRECWRINALINERTYGDMFIDSQTGELIKYRERHIYL